MYDWMLPPESLHARLDVELPDDPAELERITRLWLELATERLAGEALDALLAAPELTSKSLSRHQGAFGDPGTPWGSLVIEAENRTRSTSLYAWTPDNFRKFLDRRLADRPRRAEVKFSRLDKWGHPGSGTFIHLAVERERFVPGWVTFYAHRQPVPDPAERDALAPLWLDFLTDAIRAIDVPVGFGCLGDDLTTAPATPLEAALRLWPGSPLQDGRLRGYAWVTVLGPSTMGCVGGVEALQESGAFDDVTAIGDGTVLVRATPVLSGYDDAAVERVFSALASALPAGEPIRSTALRSKLAYIDAASVD